MKVLTTKAIATALVILIMATTVLFFFLNREPELDIESPRIDELFDVPRVEVKPKPEEEDNEKKQLMINELLPAIQAENRRALATRRRLHEVAVGLLALSELTEIDFNWLKAVASEYNLEPDRRRDNHTFFSELESRIDIIPASLVIAQAALETDWGTSRYAREGNNYFGQQCVFTGCGFLPEVPEGEDNTVLLEITKFSTIQESVREHLLNLNVHPAHKPFRVLRKRLREDGIELTGSSLAEGLINYSDERELYTDSLKALILSNELDNLKNF